jgi:hypothetical protein
MKSNGKPLIALLGAAAVSLLFSGCFTWSSFKWSSTTVEAGKSTHAVIGMRPSSEQADRDYPFILVGFSGGGSLELGNKRTWDVKGKFGGPEDLVTDSALEAAILNAPDACELNGEPLSHGTDVAWTALRTDKLVNDRDKFDKQAIARIQIKAPAGTPAHEEQVYFLGGGWDDSNPNNGAPASNEVGCSGGTISFLRIK